MSDDQLGDQSANDADAVSGVVVFTDIVGFTEFTAVSGDAAANDLLSAQEAIVEDELPPGARVVKELGDGLMLWFPNPRAALAACLALQRRFERHTEETMQPLWVRMGMHWGRQVKRRDDLIGHDVNLASRIADQAGPSELLLSEITRDCLAASIGGEQFEEIGPIQLKGIPNPVRLFRAQPGP